MPSDPRRVFPRRLRYFIRENQRAFCQEHGFDETRLSKLLHSDELNPKLDTIWRYAQALGIEPAELITDPESTHNVGEAAAAYDSKSHTEQLEAPHAGGDELPVEWKCPHCGATLITTASDS
jgi:transcriptional regulator with XRE-family HTH domain